MGNRVEKEVWVGADRVKTLGDLQMWVNQIVEAYGSDKPISGVTLGRGNVVRPFPTIGEVWHPNNRGCAQKDCDAVFFMLSTKGKQGHFDEDV